MQVKVGFIGTGIMGIHMARNLLKANVKVQAWNRSIEKAQPLESNGAIICNSTEEACKDATHVILMLSDANVCDEVLAKGVYDTMSSKSSLMVMATTDLASAKRQAIECENRSIHYVDAPVSGGEKGAKDGTLAIMVGGSQQDFDACYEVLEKMGRPTHVGPAGSGQLAKVTNQMIVALNIVAMSESLLLAEKGGANLAKVREALLGGFADSTILKQHALRMIEKNFEPGGPAKYQLKDLKVATQCAKEFGLDLPMLQYVENLFKDFVEQGGADLDHSGVIEQLRKTQK